VSKLGDMGRQNSMYGICKQGSVQEAVSRYTSEADRLYCVIKLGAQTTFNLLQPL
jgi:hypothetical protein